MTTSDGTTESNTASSEPGAQSEMGDRGGNEINKSISLSPKSFLTIMFVWFAFVVMYLSIGEMFSLVHFFFGIFVGFLILVEITNRNDEQKTWDDKLRWLLPPGYLLVGYVVYTEIQVII